MDRLQTVSVILPVYNNRNTIHELYKQLIQVIATLNLKYEIIFVDDCCPQNSSDLIEPITKKDTNVICIKNETNMGQHKSILHGLKYAKGDFIVIMDADLQDSPKTIIELFDHYNSSVDIVFAGRKGVYQSNSRMITSKIFKRTLAKIINVPADAGLFMIMRNTVVKKLLKIETKHPFIIAMIGLLNVNMISIPIERNSRPEGLSSYSSMKRLKIGIQTLIWASWNKIKYRKLDLT